MTEGHPTLVLLHGLGATSGVWADLRAELDWPGRVVVPDLAGHGSSPWTGDYTVGALAASVSAHLRPGEPVVIVGHSLGGAVGLSLASGFFRPEVRSVLGLGIKVGWTEDDVAGMAKLAFRGIRWFDTEAEAIGRFLRQAGLDGVVGPDHPAVEDAVVTENGRWRVAQDPASFAQKALDMRGLMDGARCPVVLGAGATDPMVSGPDLAAFVHEPRIAPRRGHNVQVEDPAWTASLVREVDRWRGSGDDTGPMLSNGDKSAE